MIIHWTAHGVDFVRSYGLGGIFVWNTLGSEGAVPPTATVIIKGGLSLSMGMGL